MATITTLDRPVGGLGNPSRKSYYSEVTIDFAAAATAKGSALAAADVIECLNIPANMLVAFAGLEVITANVGGSSDVTLDLGITGVEADNFVDGFDFDAAAVGAYAQAPAAYQPVINGGTADTLDLLIATATTAPTGGKVRVWMILWDIDGFGVSKAADEVDRDQLA